MDPLRKFGFDLTANFERVNHLPENNHSGHAKFQFLQNELIVREPAFDSPFALLVVPAASVRGNFAKARWRMVPREARRKISGFSLKL